jgi:hypothetical protein
MERGFRESDWRLFRQLRPLALDRFCQGVLAEVSRLAAATDRSSHERYLAVFELVGRRNQELAEAFDNPRRSTTLLQLVRLRARVLLTDEEFARFSPEARAAARAFLDVRQAGPVAGDGPDG